MQKWIGKSVLFTVSGLAELDGKILDGKVYRLSPSGKYVEVGMSWFRVDQATVLEELPATGPSDPAPPLKVLEPVPALSPDGTMPPATSPGAAMPPTT